MRYAPGFCVIDITWRRKHGFENGYLYNLPELYLKSGLIIIITTDVVISAGCSNMSEFKFSTVRFIQYLIKNVVLAHAILTICTTECPWKFYHIRCISHTANSVLYIIRNIICHNHVISVVQLRNDLLHVYNFYTN